MRQAFQGIENFTGSPPIGVVVKVGHRVPGSSGAPQDTNRFYLLTPQAEVAKFTGGRSGRARPWHPAFRSFNELQTRSSDLSPSEIRGSLAYNTRDDNLRYCRRASKLVNTPVARPAPGGGTLAAPPGHLPACEGDGRRARRFAGVGRDGTAQYIEIDCTVNCPFLQHPDPACKVMATLYFHLRWPSGSSLLPMLAQWSTRSPQSLEACLGLIEYIEGLAEQLNVSQQCLFGFPFLMSVAKKGGGTKEQPRSYPVVTFTIDSSDMLGWWRAQIEKIKALGGDLPRLPPAAAAAEKMDRDAAHLLELPPTLELDVPQRVGVVPSPVDIIDLEPLSEPIPDTRLQAAKPPEPYPQTNTEPSGEHVFDGGETSPADRAEITESRQLTERQIGNVRQMLSENPPLDESQLLARLPICRLNEPWPDGKADYASVLRVIQLLRGLQQPRRRRAGGRS